MYEWWTHQWHVWTKCLIWHDQYFVDGPVMKLLWGSEGFDRDTNCFDYLQYELTFNSEYQKCCALKSRLRIRIVYRLTSSDRFAWVNSAGPDQTAPLSSLIRVYTVCHSVFIVWTHFSMIEQNSSHFRVITTNILGVRIFRKYLR